MVAGPNGSGKTTLMRRLAADYAVNFYDILNADDIFAEVCRTNAYLPPMPVEPDALCRYIEHDRRLPHWASFMEMSAHGEGDRTIAGYAH